MRRFAWRTTEQFAMCGGRKQQASFALKPTDLIRLTLSGSNHQHRHPFYVAVLSVAQGTIRICQGVRRRSIPLASQSVVNHEQRKGTEKVITC
jgi:hypothetical protein